MSNTICMPKNRRHEMDDIRMSNGLTSVFVEVLVLSGSILAKADREKEMIIWLAQQDQSVVGVGTIGFALDDMPWTLNHFEREKAFMLRTIAGAMEGLGWERLSYEPRKDWVLECLSRFQSMIHAFDQENVNMNSYLYWSEIEEDDDSPTIPRGYPKCSKHQIYLSCHGCILCNNE